MSLLKYSPKIDKALMKVVENDLETKVISADRIQAGEVSFVYKVQTQDKGTV